MDNSNTKNNDVEKSDDIPLVRKVKIDGSQIILGGPYVSIAQLIENHLKVNGIQQKELAMQLDVRQSWISEVKAKVVWKEGELLDKVAEKFSIYNKAEIIKGVLFFNHSEFRSMTLQELYIFYANNNDSEIGDGKKVQELLDCKESIIDKIEACNDKIETVIAASILEDNEELIEIKDTIHKEMYNVATCLEALIDGLKKHYADLTLINGNVRKTYDKIDEVYNSIDKVSDKVDEVYDTMDQVHEQLDKASFDTLSYKLQILGKGNLEKSDMLTSMSNKIDHIIGQLKLIAMPKHQDDNINSDKQSNVPIVEEKNRSRLEELIDQSVIVLALALIFILFNSQGNVVAILTIISLLLFVLGAKKLMLKRQNLKQ